MGRQFFVTPVEPLHSAGGLSYNTSVTLTDVSTLPQITIGGYTLTIGTKVRARAAGFFSNTGTPTLLLGFYYGGVAGLALAASSAITTTTGAASWPFIMEYSGTVRTIGATGTIIGSGKLYLGTALTAFTIRPIPEVAANRTVTIDTTVSKTLTVGAQWGTSSASNALVCDELLVELIN